MFMNAEDFRAYLRNLQKISDFKWPNDYFAWEKPDGSLFMVGIWSGQADQLLTYERSPRVEKYSGRFYSIATWMTHTDRSGNKYDPVEKLVDKIADCKYLGTWRDPDMLMESPIGYSKVIACGRWELAKAHILQQEKKLPLTAQIAQAEDKTAGQAVQQGREVPFASHNR